MTLDATTLKYSREHEWVSANAEGIATIGITDYAQSELGDVVYVQLPSVGDRTVAHGKIGEIESVKSVSDLFCPVSGEVVEVNAALEQSPEKVNEEPYGDGWMFRVRMDDARELESMLSAVDYQSFLSASAGGQ
ncbi:MAG: glycine cleavage system protein GcvH [Chloroflexi bacterium]|nr:glycine cleavage system protein GcvH [Chloroflexota bacterium]